jgi:hypothetical protein
MKPAATITEQEDKVFQVWVPSGAVERDSLHCSSRLNEKPIEFAQWIFTTTIACH